MAAGIKLYGSTYTMVDDNYIYNNTVGIFDKEGGNDGSQLPKQHNTYTRNWLTGNTDGRFLGQQSRWASNILYL